MHRVYPGGKHNAKNYRPERNYERERRFRRVPHGIVRERFLEEHMNREFDQNQDPDDLWAEHADAMEEYHRNIKAKLMRYDPQGQ